VMAIALALAAAAGWGTADYFGGRASRHDTPVFLVVAIGELLGAVLLVPVLVVHGAPPPLTPRLLLAAVAGVAVTAELSLIYRALSQGLAFITAPTGALGTAAAVTIGLIGGDPVGPALAVGLVCALLGGGISAWNPSTNTRRGDTSRRHAATVCLGAAAAVGTMLITLHAAGRQDPYWATVTEHATTSLSAGLAARIGAGRPLHELLPARPQLPTLALIAAAGVAGDLAYTSASHTGALSIVSAISSLYPLTTIAIGRFLQGQRATRIQIAGIILALTGAALLGATTP
jgi:drug/metabolite transporter (DMT)-like permease